MINVVNFLCKREMSKRRYYIYIIISFLLLGALSFYAWFYHNGISNNVNDWSAFGNYFSGFMMPFLTTANIVVFIELTIAISGYEAKLSAREMEQQQALLIMQFRRQSIESFYQHINPLFDDKEKVKGNIEQVYADSIVFLKKFLDIDIKYFDFEKASFTESNIRHLLTQLEIIYYDMTTKKQFNSDKFMKSFDIKNEIIDSLVSSTLYFNIEKE